MTGLRDTVLRLFPHAVSPGLRRIGNPSPEAPVLITGNYALTVRRLESVLRGYDAWLLIANSRGINVWCAAGGGHFTHHDVIAAIRSGRLAEHVSHRRVILPQLAATGIEPKRILEAAGFEGRWGPARLEDLPEFIERGCRVKRSHRRMRFPAWERAEIATMWAVPIAVLAGLVLIFTSGARIAVASVGAVVAEVFVIFLALPRVPIVGRFRWLTFAGAAFLAAAVAAGALQIWGGLDGSALVALCAAVTIAAAILSLDIAGTTPLHPGTINSIGNHYHLELVEDRCKGAADCVQVCPRNVLQMKGRERRVQIARPEDCMLCGSCIVQCPHDAFRFRFEDGRLVEPETIRATHLNLLGRRSAGRS
ncbi:MAG: 4Fe-4S binding protein [Candidatus Eisenbacteria bacterium]|uniref:4Fe-4S binding protein n=1 Tax=Eiseniibacteriota bacterium TaxID=2212470 RepID=A0A956M0Z8_UNCEI|nr:4Fe-4S binding protein [Candidatus Eisenbacteria bacterium]